MCPIESGDGNVLRAPPVLPSVAVPAPIYPPHPTELLIAPVRQCLFSPSPHSYSINLSLRTSEKGFPTSSWEGWDGGGGGRTTFLRRN